MKTADCVVIGGGVMGCSIALRLAQARVRTIVLEKAIPGAEASSAAAGILAAQEESRGPGPLTDLAVASRARFPALAAELREATGIDIGHRETGLLSACLDDTDEPRLEARYGWQRAAGLRLSMLRGDDLRAAEPGLGPAVRAAMHFPDDGQLDSRPYARALSLAAARAGAEILSGACVQRIATDHGGRVRGVELLDGNIEAPVVVLAAGSWSGLVPGSGLPAQSLRPVRGQIAQLMTTPPAVRGTVITPRGGYLCGRADGRVLCGSTMENVGFEKAVTAGGLAHVLTMALELVPGLRPAPVTEIWANFRPTTEDKTPIIGHSSAVPGLLVATGHYRNGILLSPITAEIIRDLIVDGRTTWDLTPFASARLASIPIS